MRRLSSTLIIESKPSSCNGTSSSTGSCGPTPSTSRVSRFTHSSTSSRVRPPSSTSTVTRPFFFFFFLVFLFLLLCRIMSPRVKCVPPVILLQSTRITPTLAPSSPPVACAFSSSSKASLSSKPLPCLSRSSSSAYMPTSHAPQLMDSTLLCPSANPSKNPFAAA